MKLRIFILFLFLPLLRAQASVIDSLMTQPRDSIGLTSDSLVLHFLEESGIPISDNNKVKLLKSGREKFIDLFEAIRQAKHHVHLEYFNFRNDSIANALFALLAEKVKEGVEVRAMFDAFPYINHAAHRDHRKIVVIDGEIAYTGGMNIADYYINGLPKIGTWRDMHMRIEGDAVNDLQEIFLTIWNKETKQNIGGEIYFPQHEDSTNIVVAIVDRTPKKNSRMLSHAYAMSIYSAQKNVHIVNPYFVPTSSIKKALNRTIDRGVNVTIMVSSASDIPFTPDAALYKLHKLMKRGATVYMYNGGFHHSKIMMIDDLFCTVGTANLNSRSLRYDYETNAFIFDKKTTAELNTMFRNDIEHCTQLTPEFWKSARHGRSSSAGLLIYSRHFCNFAQRG